MKRKILLSLFIIVCLLTVGCGKQENKKEELKLKDGWEIDLSIKEVEMPKEVKDIFNRANDKNYEVVALLGTQVVAGTNYAVLALGKSADKKTKYSFNIVTIYEDLEKNVELTSVAYLDLGTFNE